MRTSRPFLLLLSLALLLASAPAALAAGGASSPARADGTIPGRYIVTLLDGADPAAVAREYRARGADVDHVYRTALRGFAGAVPASEVERLRADPRVVRVEADGWVHTTALSTQSSATWGLDRVDQRALPRNGTYTYETAAAAVTAYVIDTGIRSSHTEFSGRMLPGFSSIDDRHGTDDCNGHGTHVAGTIGGTLYGVAKGVSLVPVRVLNCRGSGTWSGVIAGVDWVTANARMPAVANMSLGGGANSSVDDAVRASIGAGVVYALAAGNDSGADACTRSPARVREGLTVGATTSTDARASYSNIGTCLDLFAPGSSITSAWIDSDTDTHTISGTSMATPHVAGAAALWLSANPSASASEANTAVVGNATANVVGNEGTGSPDLLLYSLFGITETVAAPAAPADFAASASSSSRIDLSWSDVSNETSYSLVIKDSQGNQVGAAVGLDQNDTSYAHTGLAPETTYGYELTATNDEGTSTAAITSATTLVAPPATPSGFAATAVSASRIDLSWNDVATETSYRLVAMSGGAVVAEIPLPQDATSYQHTGLSSSTTYSYELTAANAGGSSAAAIASATTPSDGSGGGGAAPTADFTYGCGGTATCTFNGSASTAGVTYAWSFGGTTEVADHTFSSPGSYTVSLTVTDADGLSGSTSRSLSCGWNGKGKNKTLACA